MKKILFICNTVYQVFGALWLTHQFHRQDAVDFIITDHMNGAEEISSGARASGVLQEVFCVHRKQKDKQFGYSTCFDSYQKRLHPETEMEQFVKLEKRYDVLYIANFDNFSQAVYYALKRRNRNLLLKMYEDGLSSYTTIFEECYLACREPSTSTDLKSKVFSHLFPVCGIVGNIDECLLFSPELLQWNPGPVRKLDPIDPQDSDFRDIINIVFSYQESPDVYDRKYLFMEEAYYADGHEIGDVELIEHLAEQVGKENIMIKIHPRNPENRFLTKGFKTNVNTAIPWEVVILNTPEMNEKILLTISSASVINPRRLFGMNPTAYSLFYCINGAELESYGPVIDVANNLFEKYEITQCRSIEEVR